MMENKHTPGPWVYEYENDNGHMPDTAWNMIQEAIFKATGERK